ncbi:MAG: YigZ family protein [Clostridia bacterium]|nr:YigZ family protein [Clostridia bacterium]MBQ6931389.1 YigZ family protein [Clostridia bacterium]
MQEYLTVAKETEDEFTVKHSRFIGYIKPVTTQEEAVEFINSKKSKHWDATHNVYAYILRDGQIRRYSDDGEPQGTAGIPVLDVLQKEGLTDCVVVVTRYFGGILLGGGGLVRAYSHAAKLAVDASGVIKMSMCVRAECECDYGYYGRLASLIPECGGTIENSDFTESVKVTFTMPQNLYGSFCAKLVDSSLGKYNATELETLFAQV